MAEPSDDTHAHEDLSGDATSAPDRNVISATFRTKSSGTVLHGDDPVPDEATYVPKNERAAAKKPKALRDERSERRQGHAARRFIRE